MTARADGVHSAPRERALQIIKLHAYLGDGA
jgi:hypothetical protein